MEEESNEGAGEGKEGLRRDKKEMSEVKGGGEGEENGFGGRSK